MLHLFCLVSLFVSRAGADGKGALESPALPDSHLQRYDEILESVLLDCGFQQSDETRTIKLHANEVSQAQAALTSITAATSIDVPPPPRAELLERWLALGEGAAAPPTLGVFANRELYVYSARDRVIESYFNADDELDHTSIWTPNVFVEYNPGRNQVFFAADGRSCTLLGLSTLYFPATLGRAYGLKLSAHTADDERERFLFARAGMMLFLEVRHFFPARAVFVDRDMSATAVDFEHGAIGPGDAYFGLTRVQGAQIIRVADGVQIQTFDRKLSHFDFDRAQPSVEVRLLDNLFLGSAANVSTEFRGRMDHLELPEILRPLIRASASPKPVWKP